MSENTNANATNETVDLTVQDLASMRSIIDVASQRGAFKPGEMVAVGTVYNKLASFLDNIAKQNEASKEVTE